MMDMRLREAGVPEATIDDLLRHGAPAMTRYCSVALLVALDGGTGRCHSPKSPPEKKNGLEA
jgi:hypothetical protein